MGESVVNGCSRTLRSCHRLRTRSSTCWVPRVVVDVPTLILLGAAGGALRGLPEV